MPAVMLQGKTFLQAKRRIYDFPDLYSIWRNGGSNNIAEFLF